MVSSAEEKQIYAEIQRRLFYIIPEKWESVYLYASIIDVPNQRPTRRDVFLLFSQRNYQEKASQLL